MAFDAVPWFVGGGAEHSAEAARNLAWVSTGGRTGISAIGDLRVTARAGGVRISPGGGSIASTYTGASQQSYMVRNPTETVVSIPTNSSGSSRTYHVIIEINDPQYAGAQPPSIEEGPYVFARAVTSLPTTHPYLRLASLVVPAGGTVTSSTAVTDRREMIAPRRQEFVHARPRVTSDQSGTNHESMARIPGRGEWFPGGTFANDNGFDVVSPDWASRVIIEAGWLGMRMNGNVSAHGQFWMEYGMQRNVGGWGTSEGIDMEYEFKTQLFTWDIAEGTAVYRTNWLLADNRSLPARARGQRLYFKYKAGTISGPTTGAVRADASAGLTCRLTFIEDPQGGHDDAI